MSQGPQAGGFDGGPRLVPVSKAPKPPAPPLSHPWKSLFVLSVGFIYLSVFLEWLFFLTKQSFMTMLTVGRRIDILCVSGFPPAASAVAILGVLWAASRIVNRPWFRGACLAAGALLPTFIIAPTVLLLIDNFTYTIFKFGIISTSGVLRAAYGVFFVILLVVSYVLCRGKLNDMARRKSLCWQTAAAAIALAVSSLAVGIDFLTDMKPSADVVFTAKKNEPLPNILYFCIDGLNARNMPVYGYPRDTTPHIRAFASQCLIADNHYSNAGASGSSFASQMTGKLPTENHLIYPPDILRGKPVYQHLPGILRKLGYRSMDMSERYYVDPFDLNMLNSFDYANDRRAPEMRMSQRLAGYIDPDGCYLLSVMFDRVYQRLLHIFGIRKMANSYAEVTESHLFRLDQSRIDRALQFMATGNKPFFVHLHLLVTHGPNFNPRYQTYSQWAPQNQFWMRDYYDSSILDADDSFQQLIDALKKQGQLDNTIVIINSDHPENYLMPYKIPLLIRFPRGEHAGRITANTQNLDIAATIVDYLGLKQPEWLGGQSLLSPINPFRILFSMTFYGEANKEVEVGKWSLDATQIHAPFYALGTLNATVGNRFYELRLREATLSYMTLPDYATPLDANDAPTTDAIKRALIEHLAANRWDTRTLNRPWTLQPLQLPYSTLVEDGIDVREIDHAKIPSPAIDDYGPKSIVAVDGRTSTTTVWVSTQQARYVSGLIFDDSILDVTSDGKSVVTASVPGEWCTPGEHRMQLIYRYSKRKSPPVIFSVHASEGDARQQRIAKIARLIRQAEAGQGAEPTKILRYGPTGATAGKGFNIQPDGSSVLWLEIAPTTGSLTVIFGDQALPTVRNDNVITATVPPALLQKPGSFRIFAYQEQTGLLTKPVPFVIREDKAIARPDAATTASLKPAPTPALPALKIVDWGPRATEAGVAVNRQPDGSSSLWFKMENAVPGVQVQFDGKPLQTFYAGPELISAVIPARLIAKPGEFKVWVSDPASGRKTSEQIFTIAAAKKI